MADRPTITRTVLRNRIRDQYREHDTGDTEDCEINQWIQEAHDEAARETSYYKREVTSALVAEQYDYDVSALYITEIEQVQYLNDGGYAAGSGYQPCEPIPWWQYKNYMKGAETAPGGDADGVPTSTGTPTHYCLHGDYLYLFRCPSYDEAEGLKIEFAGLEDFGDPSNTDHDTKTSHLPRQFEYLVSEYGMYRWFEKDNDHGRANAHYTVFQKGILSLRHWVKSLKIAGPTRAASSGERKVRIS